MFNLIQATNVNPHRKCSRHASAHSRKAESVLSTDSDIRFTRRKLGDSQRCGCAVVVGFLLTLLLASIAIYLGCKFSINTNTIYSLLKIILRKSTKLDKEHNCLCIFDAAIIKVVLPKFAEASLFWCCWPIKWERIISSICLTCFHTIFVYISWFFLYTNALNCVTIYLSFKDG